MNDKMTEELIDRLRAMYVANGTNYVQAAADKLEAQAERIKVLELDLDVQAGSIEAVQAVNTRQAERIKELEGQLDDATAAARSDQMIAETAQAAASRLLTERDTLRAQLAEIEEAEPVLVVEKEPDYWSGGHFHEGSKSHIGSTKVWRLPIGTKLFTRPMPAEIEKAEPVIWAISYDGVTPYTLWHEGDGPLLDCEVKRQGGTTQKMPLFTAAPAPQAQDKSDNYLSGYCTGRTDLLKEQSAQPVAQITDAAIREIADCIVSNLDSRKGVIDLDLDDDMVEEIMQEMCDTIAHGIREMK